MSAKKMYGLLGKNISYSYSPYIHNRAFSYFNIPAEYKIFDISEGELSKFLFNNFVSRQAPCISGLNVTIPHKARVFDIFNNNIDAKIDSWVKRIQSTNTINYQDGEIELYNTDSIGFWESLCDKPFTLKIRENVIDEYFIIGIGGAGRAIAGVISEYDSKRKINIYDKNVKNVNNLNDLKTIPKYTQDTVNIFYKDSDFFKALEGKCCVLINATPSNDFPLFIDVAKNIKKESIIFDVSYSHESQFLQVAKNEGLKVIDGTEMFINQASLSFWIWNKDKYMLCRNKIKEVMWEEYEKIKKRR